MNWKIIQWRSLNTRVTIFTLIISVVSLWSLAFYAARTLRTDMERQLGAQQFSTVSIVAANINWELDERLRALEAAARGVRPTLLGNPAALQILLEERPALLQMFNGGSFVTGIDGTAIASIPISVGRIGVNYLDRDFIIAALKEGKPAIGKPVMGKLLKSPVFVIASPIRDAQGKVIGALAGVTDLGQPSFLDKITGNAYGKTGGYVLIERQSRLVITATDRSRIMESLPAAGVHAVVDRFAQGYEGSAVSPNPKGVEVLVSGKGIPVAGWYLLASLPTEEAFAPISDMRERMIGAALILTLLAGGLIWWMLRRQLEPMLAAARALAIISDTNAPPRPLPITSQDEVGKLIGGFNRLLETLKHREESMRESEERYHELFDQANEGLMVMTREGKLLDANHVYAEMHGYTVDEIKRLDITELDVLKETTLGKRADIVRRIEAGEVVRFEVEHHHKDGHSFPLSVTASNIQIEGQMCYLAFHQDITERKLSETAIRQSGEEQAAMFESATSGIAFIKNRFIAKGNRTLDHLFGYEHGEQAGLSTRHWYVDDEAYEVGGTPYAGLARGEVHQREQQLVRKDGTKFWCRLSGSAIEAADLSRGTVWMLTDVTQEHKAAEALRQAKDAAESANRAKSEFLANMSHEIRTPLNGLIGNAQLLEMSEPTSEQKEYLSAIMLSGSNLLSLINDILDLSKIEAEKVVLEQADFSLRGCFNNVVRTQRSRIANKGLSLKLEIPNDVPDALIGDELRVKQILLNLLGNAIKFTKEGGITLAAAIKEQTSSKALIELAVTDTGIGIPKAVADDIFKPFVQADSSTTRKYGGSGLGLTISRRLTELMGGSISVESTEGVGSAFRVLLPFPVMHQVVQEYSVPAVAPVALWPGPALNVLLAEDNEINQQIGVALLKKMGHQVSLAQNGKEALAALEQAAFDLVLMDIQMPVMDGQEALAVLRERERGTGVHLLVIALTAYALKGDEEKFLAAGFDGYVTKPLEVKKLVAEMGRVLELKGTAESGGA